VCDNALWHGRVARPEELDGWKRQTTDAVLEHNRLVSGDPRYVSSIVPTRDGVLVALRLPG
jgi:predicted O-methyltransferase YrrM